MKKYHFQNLTRINKTEAKRRYNDGENIFFIPCNLNPENNFYNLGIWENKYLWGQYEDFETLYGWYTFCNCNNETGKYIAFYIRKELK